jgi:Asp-tRNA(Asn)/Glu-tRNA(Gln) amidotransferase A subunit family amidase
MLAQGALSPVEILDAYLTRIDRYNEDLRSCITVCRLPRAKPRGKRNPKSAPGAAGGLFTAS